MLLSDRIRLRHLEIFVEIARHGSVTRAAEALSLTQPAVSRSLRELETTLGKPLTEKAGRGLRLSPFGVSFVEKAARAVALAREAVDETRRSDGPPVALGALPTVSATIVPEAVARFRALALGSRLTVRSGENDVLLEQLQRGALDLVVGRLPAPERMLGLTFEPLYRERVVAVVARDHRLAGRPLTPDALAAGPVLVPSRGSIIETSVARLLLEHGLTPPQDAIATVSDSFGRAFVLDHGAVWFISEGVVRADLAAGRMTALPLDTATTLGPVGLCLRQDAALASAALRLADLLREAASGRS